MPDSEKSHRPFPKLLSIVSPIFNELAVLPTFRKELMHVISQLECPVEIIAVDDGSADETFQYLMSWAREDPRLHVIRFSRNFGQQAAITAGLDHASGEAVIVMDCDLQDPPPLIPKLLREYCNGFEIVHARRLERRGEGIFKRSTAALFYFLMRRFVHAELPRDVGDFRLISRNVLLAIGQLREGQRFLRGMFAWMGYPQTVIQFERPARVAGTTKFPLQKMMRFALDALFSFSSAPLRFVTYLGLIVFFFGFAYSVYTVVRKFVLNDLVPGWATIVILQSIIGGALLIGLGMIGEYVGRIYDEIKQRPLYIIREKLNFSADPPLKRAVSNNAYQGPIP